MIRTIEALVTALGGRQAVCDLLGVTNSAISNYAASGDLPAWTAERVNKRAEEIGVLVSPDLFRPLQKPVGRTRSPTIAAE